MKFSISDPHSVLLVIGEFRKIQPREGDTLVMGLNKYTLTLNRGAVRHSGSQEDLGKICVNASRSASLLVLFQAIFNSGRQALIILPSDAPELRAYYDDFSTIFTVLYRPLFRRLRTTVHRFRKLLAYFSKRLVL